MPRLRSLLLVILFCLPASFPYWGGEIPRSNDSLTHLYRAVELSELLRSGNLIPRWAPDLAVGYGYPIFNYFAYGSHYLISLINLAGVPLLWALRLSYIFAIVLTGVGAYVLAYDLANPLTAEHAENSGERREIKSKELRALSPNSANSAVKHSAGILAALVYVYSPYLLYTAHVRGGLPENLALAFLPFALWATRRALVETRYIASLPKISLAALFIALLIFSHIGMVIQHLPLIALFGVFISFTSSARNLGKSFFTLTLIFTIALALTAFIWIPSISELSYTQFDQAFAASGLNYRNQFFIWQDLFTLPQFPLYSNLVNPPLVRSLPLVALALTIIAAFTSKRNLTFYFFLVTALGTIFLTLNLSIPIWDVIPLLQRSTFPWRFLGPASLCLALAASYFRPSSSVLRHATLILIFISALPFLYPPREPAPENPTLTDLARYEIPPLLVGTTTTGEYTPIWVKEFPNYQEDQQNLIAGKKIERLTIKGWQIEPLTAQPTYATYRLTGAAAATATYRTFYFPGWQATLEGKPLELKPSDPNGFITFNLPAGTHTLEIYFGDTPTRQIANGISLIALVMILILVFSSWRLERHFQLPISDFRLLTPDFWLLTSFYFSLFLFPLFFLKQTAPPMSHALNTDVAGELILHGYDLQYNAPNKATLTLLWQAQHILGVNYGITLRLIDEQGLQWQDDSSPEEPRNWRFRPGTDQWQPAQYFYDSYVLKPIAGTPPNTYQIQVVVYRAENRQPVSTLNLGEFKVERATPEPLGKALVTFDGLALLNISADRAEAAVGSPYRLDLKWQAQQKIKDQKIKVELLDAKQMVVWQKEENLTPNYAPSRWQVGDTLIQSIFLRLPASLEAGEYRWRVNEVYLAPLKINVTAPARVLVEPKMSVVVRTPLSEAITLLGYDLQREGDHTIITLHWQAQQEMDHAYRVFVHALNKDNELVAQSDGEPVNWTRPTTSWVKGEVVSDTRVLQTTTFSQVVVGMVDETGIRIGAINLMK